MKLIVVVLLATLMQGIQSQSEASVDCGHPGNVINGEVDVSEGTKLHATARYTCDEGFIRNGAWSRTCGSDGRWSGTTPTCEVPITCPDLEDIEHGSVEVTRFSTIYSARYTCDVGYEMRGWWSRHCNLLTGEWGGTAPTCEETNVDCGHPGNITNGTVDVSEGTKVNAEIYYTCDRGYRVNGPSSRTCSSRGAWSGREPTCEVPITCPDLEDIEHGSVEVTQFSTIYFARYTCDVGYEMRGWWSRDCNVFTGEWEGPAPTCEETNVDCGHPGNIQYGTVDVSEGTKVNARISYTCDRGYRVNGPSERTCSSRGAWSGREPICQVPTTCPDLEDIEHGSVEVTRFSTIYSARYTCDVGYEMRGWWHRRCNVFTGEWEGIAPTCEETNVDCGNPGNITNGTVDVSEGTKVNARIYYTCDGEYRLNGPSERTCSSRGAWGGREPTCEVPTTCPDLEDIEHGSVEVTRFSTIYSARYTCDVGYEMRGWWHRRCNVFTGEWEGIAPTCEESNVDCGHPGRITNGRVDVSRGTKLGAKVRYSCKRGYKLKGPSTRKCQSNGHWNTRVPTCKKRN